MSDGQSTEKKNHLSSVPKEVFVAVCERLGETKPMPKHHIGLAIRALGIKRVTELVDHACAIQDAGGQFTSDGKRRTTGGIFFRLVGLEAPKWLGCAYAQHLRAWWKEHHDLPRLDPTAETQPFVPTGHRNVPRDTSTPE